MFEQPVPLYLGAHARVVLEEGPSLVAYVEGTVPLRLPLAYCARIVMHRAAWIESEALMACIRHGIPIVWVSEEGAAEAMCVPCRPDALQWGDVLRQAWGHEAWDERYASWYRAQRRIALRALAERYRMPPPDGRDEEWLKALMERFCVRQAWSFWALRQWRGMLVGLVQRFWLDAGYSPSSFYCRLRGWDFASDLASLLALDMCCVLIDQAAHWRKVRAQPLKKVRAALIEALERRAGRLQRLAMAVHRRFFRWLLEWEDWA